MVVAGLVVVFFSLAEEKKTMLVVMCAGPCLVMLGVTCMLLRILFTYKPTCLVQMERRHKEDKFRKYRFEEESRHRLEKRDTNQKTKQKLMDGALKSDEATAADKEMKGNENGRHRRSKPKLNEVVINVSKLG